MGSLLASLGCGGGGGGGGPTVLLLDHFAGADGTPIVSHAMDVGPGWVLAGGACQLQSGRAVQVSGNVLAYADAGKADVTLSALVTPVVTDASGSAGVVFRLQDGSNFWCALLFSQQWLLFECVAGSLVQRAGGAFAFTAGTQYAMQAVLSGGSISVTVDGGNALDYASADFQGATAHGFRCAGTTGAGVDDFEVTG